MNTPGQNANAVAELVFGMILGLCSAWKVDMAMQGMENAYHARKTMQKKRL